MPAILIPCNHERRQAAHLRDDGRTWSLCETVTATGFDVIADTPQERLELVELGHLRICRLCLSIERARAQSAETAKRTPATPLPKPTARELDAERLAKWEAAAKAWAAEHVHKKLAGQTKE